MPSEYLPGSGSPYWYEWLVGLDYALDLLPYDSNVTSVVFQSSTPLGLDDVVITRSETPPSLLQVKFSQHSTPLTFADLVSSVRRSSDASPSQRHPSLLSSIARAWNSVATHRISPRAILFTNRPLGSRTSGTYPPLDRFLERLTNFLNVSNVDVVSEMLKHFPTGWPLFFDQLEDVPERRRLRFLRAFTILANQPDLEHLEFRIHQRLKDLLGVSDPHASVLFRNLKSALSHWTTADHQRERTVTAETLLEVLGAGQTVLGHHDLRPPSPPFPSRSALSTDLKRQLKRAVPIIFLTGPPGSGKTSCISNIAVRAHSAIDLRFHAYRPITPETEILPLDSDITTSAKALWSDLLNQLWMLLRDNRRKYKVPVRPDFLDATEARAHVLRISKQLAAARGRPVVIAIDGLDHAARAGISNLQTLLDSLIPPSAVPDGVTLLLAGQPPDGNPAYPAWLRVDNPDVVTLTVPEVTPDDIQVLLRSTRTRSSDQENAFVRVITRIAAGSSLAAVYAAKEAENFDDPTELELHLDTRRLSESVTAYYEHIWAFSISQLPDNLPYLAKSLAACISLSRERLTGTFLSLVFPGALSDPLMWHSCLTALKPLLREEVQGFRVEHNDVRVFLTSLIANDPQHLSHVASRMADAYIESSEGALGKHRFLFGLLRLANRSIDQARLMTPAYCMEGWVSGASFATLVDNATEALRAAIHARDYTLLHQCSCAWNTLNQIYRTYSWTSREDELAREIEQGIPTNFSSEIEIKDQQDWTPAILRDVLEDADALATAHEYARAIELLDLWWTDKTVDLEGVLFPPSEEPQDYSPAFSDGQFAAETLGRLSYLLDKDGQHSWQLTNLPHPYRAAAYGYSGWLQAAAKEASLFAWGRALRQVRCSIRSDMEQLANSLASAGEWGKVLLLLRSGAIPATGASLHFRCTVAIWAILSEDKKLIADWVAPETTDDLSLLDNSTGADGSASYLALVLSFLRSWHHHSRPPTAIRDEVMSRVSRYPSVARQASALSTLIHIAAWAGSLLRIHSTGLSPTIDPTLLRSTVYALTNTLPGFTRWAEHESLARDLLRVLFSITSKVGGNMERIVLETLLSLADPQISIESELEIWKFFAARGRRDRVRSRMEALLKVDAPLWAGDRADIHSFASTLSKAAVFFDFDDLASIAVRRLEASSIGYVGHKEYSLSRPLLWFDALSKTTPGCWSDYGLRLISLSRYATLSGDNREDIFIRASVISDAVSEAPAALWNLSRSLGWGNITTDSTVDGIIAALQTLEVNAKDLASLWFLGLGSLLWQARRDREYIADLRQAIQSCADRNSLATEDIFSMSPLEVTFGRETDSHYRHGPRWFFDRPHGYPGLTQQNCQEALTASLQRIEIDDETSLALNHVPSILTWMYERGIAPSDDALTLAHSLLEKASIQSSWSWAGYRPFAQALFPYLDVAERWSIANALFQGMETADIFVRVERSWDDLDSCCLWNATEAGAESLAGGLRCLLDMHESWVSSFGRLPDLERIPVNTDPEAPTTWIEYATRSLLCGLSVRGCLDLESRLRNLLRLWLSIEDVSAIVASSLSGVPDPDRRWLFFLLEHLSRSNSPLPSSLLAPAVDSVKTLKPDAWLQAWICLDVCAHPSAVRTPSQLVSATQSRAQAADLNATVIVALDHSGTAVPASVVTSKVETLLAQLRTIDASVADRMALKIASGVPAQGYAVSKDGVRPGDAIRNERGHQAFQHALATEVASGALSDVSIRMIAQAALCSEDPFLLVDEKPSQATDWPNGSDLQALLDHPNFHTLIKDSAKRIVASDLDGGHHLFAATCHFFCPSMSITWQFGHYVLQDPLVRGDAILPTTFNGRSFTFYDDSRYEQATVGTRHWLVVRPGGLRTLFSRTFELIPTALLTEHLGWRPSEHDPRTWLTHGRPVLQFTMRLGPVRDIWTEEPLWHQPYYQAWTCTSDAWKDLKRRLSPPISYETITARRH